MKNSRKSALVVAGALAALAVGATVVIAAPNVKSPDVVVMGDLDHFVAGTQQGAEAGKSMGFDEESALQQEKTAGFSGGAVVSNLEELPAGVTAYSERQPVGTYATTGEPSTIGHGEGNGAACLACHENGPVEVPQSHVSNGLTEEQCLDCHEYPAE